jgi:hypothetical protein
MPAVYDWVKYFKDGSGYRQTALQRLTKMVMIREIVAQFDLTQCCAGDNIDFGIPESLLSFGFPNADR